MLVKLFDKSRFVFITHILSEKVLVIRSILPAELVWFLLVVIGIEMAENSWSHVCVIGARSDSWEHHGSSLLVALPSNEPAWEDDGCEVGKE